MSWEATSTLSKPTDGGFPDSSGAGRPDGSISQIQLAWSYDALGRLTKAESTDVTGVSPSRSFIEEFDYDLVGNRLTEVLTTSASALTVQSSYDTNDRLLQVITSDGSVTTYTYDASGSLMEVIVDGRTAMRYTYNHRNQLATATEYGTDAAGGETVSTTRITYNPTGPRSRVETTITVGGSAAGSLSRNFLYDTSNQTGYAQVLEERDSAAPCESATFSALGCSPSPSAPCVTTF